MADDNTLRSYRPNDPSRREAASVGRDRSNDPLVELARLIGQNDPFADVGRGNARDWMPTMMGRRTCARTRARNSGAAAHSGLARDARHPMR